MPHRSRTTSELAELARELRTVVEATERNVDVALDRLAARKAQVEDRDRLKAKTRAEIEASGHVWPFSTDEGGEFRSSST